HRLASTQIATIIESLASIAPPRLPRSLQLPADRRLLLARACYGHLTGQLGVTIAARLTKDRAIPELQPGETANVHTLAHPLLNALHITELAEIPAVRACLDWSHGTTHLAGGLGRRIFDGLLAAGWLRRR